MLNILRVNESLERLRVLLSVTQVECGKKWIQVPKPVLSSFMLSRHTSHNWGVFEGAKPGPLVQGQIPRQILAAYDGGLPCNRHIAPIQRHSQAGSPLSYLNPCLCPLLDPNPAPSPQPSFPAHELKETRPLLVSTYTHTFTHTHSHTFISFNLSA